MGFVYVLAAVTYFFRTFSGDHSVNEGHSLPSVSLGNRDILPKWRTLVCQGH